MTTIDTANLFEDFETFTSIEFTGHEGFDGDDIIAGIIEASDRGFRAGYCRHGRDAGCMYDWDVCYIPTYAAALRTVAMLVRTVSTRMEV